MYAYSGFTLLYSRNEYNIVKQLSSNKNAKEKTTENRPRTSIHLAPHCGVCFNWSVAHASGLAK